MATKQELIQIRVDPELKRDFFNLAEKQGVSPSTLLRSLMHQVIVKDDANVENAESNIRSIHTILLEALKFIHRLSFEGQNEQLWDMYKKSFLPEYLDELIGQTLLDSDISGEQFSFQRWQEIDELWGTSFQEKKPLLAMHLRRDVMQDLRNQMRSHNT